MLTKPLLGPILENDALTRGLGDPEARILIEWLVEQAEACALDSTGEAEISLQVQQLCRRGRAIGRFVALWCQNEWGAAFQLAAAERFPWPLPTTAMDPCELMQQILSCEAMLN